VTVAGTDTPVAGTDTPVVGTDKPAADTDMPVVGSDTPVADTDMPVVGTDTPVADTNTPVAGTDTPVADTLADPPAGHTPISNTSSVPRSLITALEPLEMPLDSHVTVASSGRRLGQMLLQDVYRVKRGAPLTLTAPRPWSPGQQFPVGPRRDNYGGAILSTATVVSLQTCRPVCWDVTLSGLVGEYRSSGDGTATNSRLGELSFRYPEVEAISVSETSVFLHQTTSHHIIENIALHPITHRITP
jgi:hypothetical protein